jgi:plasmid maintenance system antidote protein VapI
MGYRDGMNTRCPAHPGRLIREYMGDTLSVTDLAAHLHPTWTNLSRLLHGHAACCIRRVCEGKGSPRLSR